MNKTALVVDDSKSARFALRKFLEGFNYKVETAENANEAYAALGKALPDVIFMDHIMPGTDGFEALRVIKTDARFASVPVVICSSNEGEAFVAEAGARGASGVLQKPPSPEQLAGVLANLSNPVPRAAALPRDEDEHPLARTLAPTLITKREPTAMERLMATIPPKLIPTAHLIGQAPANAAPVAQPPSISAPALPTTLTAAIPPPAPAVSPLLAPIVSSPKVQSLREPAVTIQQAVMKSIRDSMNAETVNPPANLTPPPPAVSLGALPALNAVAEEPAQDALDARFSALRRELLSELAALRGQIGELAGTGLDDKIRNVASDAAKARTSALASTLEQHLSALRGNLDAILRAQNERIEQLLQVSRQTAAEEAERTVMKAAQRISDQMAESILKTLGPQLSAMRKI